MDSKEPTWLYGIKILPRLVIWLLTARESMGSELSSMMFIISTQWALIGFEFKKILDGSDVFK